MTSNRRPALAGFVMSLVGPGRVGASLAHWAAFGGARVAAVAGRSGASAARLASALGTRAVPSGELASAGQDLLLLTVPDVEIESVAAALARRPQAGVALHCSGSLGAEVLAPLARRGSSVGAFHPLRAFPQPLLDPEQAAGVFFALDGDAAAQALGRRLASAFQGTAGAVSGPARVLYHLAATLAAGGVVTLLAAASSMTRELGLPDEVERGLFRLATGALETATRGGDLGGAITGPVARGEAATVERHLAALAAYRPQLLPLVAALGVEALRARGRSGPLDRAQRDLLTRLENMSNPR